MLTFTVTLDSLSTYIVVADILILLSYVLYLFHKKRALEKSVNEITAFVTEYFSHTGVQVIVSCFKLEGNKRFVVLIESQPLKRFRFSNVLEVNLISHIQEMTGNFVEKIYWRFTIQFNKDGIALPENNGKENEDNYFSGGIAQIEESTGYKVSEATWNEFENSKNE